MSPQNEDRYALALKQRDEARDAAKRLMKRLLLVTRPETRAAILAEWDVDYPWLEVRLFLDVGGIDLPPGWRVEFVRTQGLNDDRFEVYEDGEVIGVGDTQADAIQDAIRAKYWDRHYFDQRYRTEASDDA